MAGGAHRNVGFGGHGVGDARPGDGEDVRLFHIAAADHHGRDGREQRAAAKLDFTHTVTPLN